MTTPAPGRCADSEHALHSFMDGELDAVHALRFEQHLSSCRSCAEEVARFRNLRRVIAQDDVRWRAPDHVRAQIMDAVRRESTGPRSATGIDRGGTASRLLGILGRWSFVPSAAALAATLFLVLAVPQKGTSLTDELVRSHVRSLLVDHLTDVQTSDRHTVKPWFSGKIDFSPPVVDLASEGFPLVGGRLDYVGERVIAALVYRRNGHVINVFVWPEHSDKTGSETRDGYSLAYWSSSGLRITAVSDLNAKELEQFRELFDRAVER